MGLFRSWIAPSVLAVSVAGCIQANQPALDYGTVTQVRPIDMPGENTGFGGLIGAGAGGAVGSQVGNGVGKIVVIVAGVVAGAVAGAATEGALQDASGLEYTVTLADSRVMTITQHHERSERVMMPGERVVLQTVGHDQRVLPADEVPAANASTPAR